MASKPKVIFWGDGIHDDTEAMQAMIDGKPVYDKDGNPLGLHRVWPQEEPPASAD